MRRTARMHRAISIHAPRTGSDGAHPRQWCSRRDFNPRSPHGERPTACWFSFYDMDISIHAPRTGSDSPFVCFRFSTNYFNPRSPHGERLTAAALTADASGFQSTLPARGATDFAATHSRQGNISIHAPRTGSDGHDCRAAVPRRISIHAPRTGSDGHDCRAAVPRRISIHAPRTGSDRGCGSRCRGIP